jgi:hypothetical protein
LWGSERNQSCFRQILFHKIEAAVSTGVAHEKFLLLTGFAQREAGSWRSGGLSFLAFVSGAKLRKAEQKGFRTHFVCAGRELEGQAIKWLVWFVADNGHIATIAVKFFC